MMERWKKIKGYDNYSVSNLGKVRNDSTGKILKQCVGTRGYLLVGLCLNGKQTMKLAHRLVAEAFIENPQSKRTVNHKNEIKTDNRAENLEWMTARENSLYGTGRERATEKRRVPIIGTDLKTGETISFPSMSEAGKRGFSLADISECCNGKRRKHKGYAWRYAKVTVK